ncbi:MAG TPA: hypothetical protein VF286_02520, partial [Acidiphilium sp.]
MTVTAPLSRRALLAAPALGLALPALMPALAHASGGTTPGRTSGGTILGRASGATPLCMVLNSGGATVSMIDMTTRKILRDVPTYREPSHWALTPDHKTLLIADASGNALFFLDPVTGAELGHKLVPDPYQLWF